MDSTHTQELFIEGMSCASCASRVERALLNVSGVTQASVNLSTERATINGQATGSMLVQAIHKAGYSSQLISHAEPQGSSITQRRETEAKALKTSLLFALLLSAPVFILEMGSHLFSGVRQFIESSIGLQSSWVLQSLLTTLVLAGPGKTFYQKGIPALLRAAPDMNSLVAIGTLAAYLFSMVATYAPFLLPSGTVNVYFEAAVVIVTLILLGRFLEAQARGRTSMAIQRLVNLQPDTALVKRESGFVDIPINQIQLNDIIQVRPGEQVALDAQLVEGQSYIDESMITGEPQAVERSVGDVVIGGTINQSGAFTARVSAIGESTVLSKIIRLVEQAQSGKLPIQSLVDRVTLWFVPFVLFIALITFVAWMVWGAAPALGLALVNTVAVLIVACPCAMGIATPTSIMVGTGRAAEMGILFRKGEALQHLKNATIVAFDKTGTLTQGKPALTDVELSQGYDEQDVLSKLAAVESLSEHPIASAIVSAAEVQGVDVPAATDFQSIPGLGVSAMVDGVRVLVGSDRYMREQGISVELLQGTTSDRASAGKTPIFAAFDGQLVASMAVADLLKDSTPKAVSDLQALGLRTAIITGDNTLTANSVGRTLGIDNVVAEVMPQGKLDAIRSMQNAGEVVAFVGDGINDAPALAAADIGIAIGTGTDVAIEAADVVLMSGSLNTVPQAVALSKATLKNIKQNLFWAFAYNTLLIPVAAGLLFPVFGLLLSPMLAAAGMALSSVFVLFNALRLRRFRALA